MSARFTGFRQVLLVLAVSVLSACATPTPMEEFTREEALARWETIRGELATIDHWSLKGKMGVRTGPKGGSATLKWRYAPDSQEIELYGPFGGGRVIINVDGSGAVLRDTKGRVIHGKSASEVLYRRLGWHVPFDHLADWARGLPGDGAREVVIDGTGRLRRMVQDNWRIEYQEYESQGNTLPGFALPAKLQVSALPGTMEIYADDGEYLGDELNVKVILNRWWEIERNSS